MSPNEFQLRAALHDGEGDAPDTEAVIANALRVRRERRRRVTSVVSAAAVVAVVAGAGTLLFRGASGGESGGAAGLATGAAAGAPYAQLTKGGNRQPQADANQSSVAGGHGDVPVTAAGDRCPGQLPQLSLPGGGASQFGADGPLFSEPVAALKVCGYAPAGDGSTELGGDRARRFAGVLEAAPATGDPLDCKALAPSYAIYGVDSSGRVLPVVTAVSGCTAYRVTNGTAVRVVPRSAFDASHLTNAVPLPNQGSPIK